MAATKVDSMVALTVVWMAEKTAEHWVVMKAASTVANWVAPSVDLTVVRTAAMSAGQSGTGKGTTSVVLMVECSEGKKADSMAACWVEQWVALLDEMLAA